MVSILYLVEELAARAYYSLYSLADSSSGKRRRMAATMLAYFAYYGTMSALLALYTFAIMVAFSAILLLNNPQLYYELAEAQCIPPIHHLFFMLGTVAWREMLEALSPRRLARVFSGLSPSGPIDPWILWWIALALFLPLLLSG
jgi:hypothetical protein